MFRWIPGMDLLPEPDFTWSEHPSKRERETHPHTLKPAFTFAMLLRVMRLSEFLS